MPSIVAGDSTYSAKDGVAIEAYQARPESTEPRPAVIVLHARNGLLPFFKECAEELAQEGFVGFSVGWQTRLPPNEERKLPSNDVVLEDIASAVNYLRKQTYVNPQRIGIMGFCAGGTLVFLSLSQVEGLASGVAHYGNPKEAINLADRLSGALLMINGDEDRAVPLEDIQRYRDRLQSLGKEAALQVYTGVGHAFTIRGSRSYHEGHARDAWAKTVSHLRQTLG